MSDRSRIQVKTDADPIKWEDVGPGAEGVPVPVMIDGLPTEGNNPETLLSFNAAKQLIYIDEVIAGTTYRQTVEGTGAKLIDDYVVVSTQTFGPAEEV